MRVSITMHVQIAATFIVAGLSACATSREGEGTTRFDAVIGEWSLAYIDGERVESGVGEAGASLAISPDGRISGFSGVNTYTAQLDLEAAAEGRWRPGPIAATRMAGPPELMDFESKFLEELETEKIFMVIEGTLALNRDGVARLNFTPVY